MGKHPVAPESYYEGDSDDNAYGWAEAARKKYNGLGVGANADDLKQIETAITNGADGISLVRTEHAFFSDERREILKAALLDQEVSAFDMLRHFHGEDFSAMFTAAQKSGRDFPVRIRLLDAPPGEFLTAAEQEKFCARMGEDNLRGVQTALKTPGLYEAQIAAVFDAAKKTGFTNFEICVPTIRSVEETLAVKALVKAQGSCRFGVMIETLEAVDAAGEIAKHCDFLNIGSNDLTSEILGGTARNNFEAIQKWMIEHNAPGRSPFIVFSRALEEKVSAIVRAAKSGNPAVKICLCGSQAAGDLDLVRKLQAMGINSISVPGIAIPVMRLFAGRAALEQKTDAPLVNPQAAPRNRPSPA